MRILILLLLVNTVYAQDTLHTLSSGIYYATGTAYTELEPSVFSQTKQGSGLLTSLTYGLAKTKSKSTVTGEHANLQVTEHSPVFYFIFDKDSKGNLGRETQGAAWFTTASSPNEFVVIQLTVNSSKRIREVITGSYNSYAGATAGIDDTQKTSFKYVKISQGIYKVYFPDALKKGEYCFMYAGSVANGTNPKVYDFGVE